MKRKITRLPHFTIYIKTQLGLAWSISPRNGDILLIKIMQVYATEDSAISKRHLSGSNLNEVDLYAETMKTIEQDLLRKIL